MTQALYAHMNNKAKKKKRGNPSPPKHRGAEYEVKKNVE
jgi:hypothetical protein